MTRVKQQMNRLRALETQAGDEEPVPIYYFANSKEDADEKSREHACGQADVPLVIIRRLDDGEKIGGELATVDVARSSET